MAVRGSARCSANAFASVGKAPGLEVLAQLPANLKIFPNRDWNFRFVLPMSLFDPERPHPRQVIAARMRGGTRMVTFVFLLFVAMFAIAGYFISLEAKQRTDSQQQQRRPMATRARSPKVPAAAADGEEQRDKTTGARAA
jgi:hypothetical protein